MSRPSPLASALRKSGASVAAAPVAEPEPAPAPVVQLAQKGDAAPSRVPVKAAKRVQPSRVATVPITVHYPEHVRRQVKMLAVEQGRTMDDLVAEALNLVFVKYRKPEVAPRKGGTAA